MAPPATIARAAIRASLRMSELLSRGTNGNSAYTPFGRRTQALWARLLRFVRQAVNAGITRLVLWAACLGFSAVGLAVALSLSGWQFGSFYPVVALAVAAAVAEAGRVRLTSTLEQSISLVPTLFAAVMFGPLASMFVSAASLSLDARRPPHLRWVTY